jgi:hypothetical protein
MLQSLFYLTIALHVSGIIITHLQEHEITIIMGVILNQTQHYYVGLDRLV